MSPQHPGDRQASRQRSRVAGSEHKIGQVGDSAAVGTARCVDPKSLADRLRAQD
jgi:hypothetical protein